MNQIKNQMTSPKGGGPKGGAGGYAGVGGGGGGGDGGYSAAAEAEAGVGIGMNDDLAKMMGSSGDLTIAEQRRVAEAVFRRYDVDENGVLDEWECALMLIEVARMPPQPPHIVPVASYAPIHNPQLTTHTFPHPRLLIPSHHCPAAPAPQLGAMAKGAEDDQMKEVLALMQITKKGTGVRVTGDGTFECDLPAFQRWWIGSEVAQLRHLFGECVG